MKRFISVMNVVDLSCEPIYLHKRVKCHTGKKPCEYTQCGKAFACHSHLPSHEISHTREKLVNVNNMLTPSRGLQRHKIHILERIPTNVMNVVKPSLHSVLYKYIEEHIWRETYDCSQCGKAFACHSHF